MDICKLKVGDTYIVNNEIYEIVVPFKVSKDFPKICFGLSRYIGSTDNNAC